MTQSAPAEAAMMPPSEQAKRRAALVARLAALVRHPVPLVHQTKLGRGHRRRRNAAFVRRYCSRRCRSADGTLIATVRRSTTTVVVLLVGADNDGDKAEREAKWRGAC